MTPNKEVSKLIADVMEMIISIDIEKRDDIFSKLMFISALSYEMGGLDTAKVMQNAINQIVDNEMLVIN